MWTFNGMGLARPWTPIALLSRFKGRPSLGPTPVTLLRAGLCYLGDCRICIRVWPQFSTAM
jgi:hypothetical protein